MLDIGFQVRQEVSCAFKKFPSICLVRLGVFQDISYICALLVPGGVRMLIVLAQFGADRWGRYCRRSNLLSGMLNTLRWMLYARVMSMFDPYLGQPGYGCS